MTQQTLILGIGNPIRGDDGLGYHLVNLLQADTVDTDSSLSCTHVQQLTMDMVPQIAEADYVIFVDARIGAPFGEIHYEEIAPNSLTANPVSHFFDPQTILSVIHSLYQRHPKAGLLSVSTDAFEFTDALSPMMQALLPRVIKRIETLIEQQNAEGEN